MEFNGEYRVPAPRETVWDGLNNPDVLKDCIEGCESFERVSDSEFQSRIKAKVGPVSARFSTTITLSELDPPSSYLITARGQGGAAGFAQGTARVTLVDDGPEATVLSYELRTMVGGKLASVGSRLISGVMNKTSDDFFNRFSDRVTGAGAEGETAEMHNEAAPAIEDAVTEDTTVEPAGPGMPTPAAHRDDDEDEGPGLFEKLSLIEMSWKDKVLVGVILVLFLGLVGGLTHAVLQ